MDDCGHDHTEEIHAMHKRAAEAVVAASSAERSALNERAQAALDEAKQTWPDISDDDLQKFFYSNAIMIERFSRMDVLTLSSALDAVFTNCTLVSAALAGAYDLSDGDTPKRNIEDIFSEAMARRQQAVENLDRNTGMFL